MGRSQHRSFTGTRVRAKAAIEFNWETRWYLRHTVIDLTPIDEYNITRIDLHRVSEILCVLAKLEIARAS